MAENAKWECLEFNQRDGFKTIVVEEVPEQGAMDWEQYLALLGFKPMSADGEGFKDAGWCTPRYNRVQNPEHLPEYQFLVDPQDHSTSDVIFVRDRADLMALRIRLAPLWGQNTVICVLQEIEDLLKKAQR